MHWKGYLPIYINQFRSYQPIYINTVRHAPDTTRHHKTPPDMLQTPPDMLQTPPDTTRHAPDNVRQVCSGSVMIYTAVQLIQIFSAHWSTGGWVTVVQEVLADLKNGAFVEKICKYVLSERAEGFCHPGWVNLGIQIHSCTNARVEDPKEKKDISAMIEMK